MEASGSSSAGTGPLGLGLSITPFSKPESSVSMKSTVSANETGIEEKIQEEEEELEYKKMGEIGETTYMEGSVLSSAGTGPLGLSITPFSKPESSVSMKSTVSANETGIEEKIQEEEEELDHKKLGETGETTYMEASGSSLAGTGPLGLSITPFSKPESSVSMKSTVSASETGIEEKIQEEEELDHKKLGETGETTYMEASGSSLAGTGLLGLSITPFSKPESSVSMKSTVSANETGIEEKIQEEEEELEYKKLGEIGETTYMEGSVLSSAGTGPLGLSITPFSKPESSVSMKSTVSANETGIEEKIQEEEEELEYKKLGETGESTYMEASGSSSAGTGPLGLGLSITPFSKPESSVSMKSTIQEEEEELEYKKLGEIGETTYMEGSVLSSAGTGPLGLSITPFSKPGSSVSVKSTVSANETGIEEKIQEEEEELDHKKLGETTYMEEAAGTLSAPAVQLGVALSMTPFLKPESSSSPFVLMKEPEVPHEKHFEEEEEEEGLEYKKMLERGETTVMKEEIQKLPPARTRYVGLGILVTPRSILETSSSPVLMKKPEVPHEKHYEEEEGLEYKKLLERGETTVVKEEIQKLPPARTRYVGLGISVTPRSILETSSSPVLMKKPEVPREKHYEEEEGLEYKKLLERGETTVVKEEIQKLPPARTRYVGLGISVTPRSILETSSSPVLMKKPEVPREKHYEEEEEEGLEYKKLLERGETTVVKEEIQKLPPARTRYVGLGISITPRSILETSSSPVLMKKPEVPHENEEEEGLEYKKLLERGETTVMKEEIQELPPHETESGYGTEEILSSSEIVSKQVKFEDKRLDIANKTDSSDIYIRTRFLTSIPNASVVEATSSSIEETSAVTELVEDIKQGWLEAMKSLELLRKHLQDFERNIKKAAQLRAKMASAQGRGNRKNRKADITNLFGIDKGKDGQEHIVQPMDNEKEIEKLLSASLDIDNSTKNHGELENEMNSNGTESTIGFHELNSHISVESKEIVENSWRKSALRRQTEYLVKNRKLTTNNPSEMRRKMLEEQRRETLVRMENGKHDKQGEIEVKSRKGKGGEDRVSNGTMYTRLMEEKARLEEARLLREEQRELRKKQELNYGFADKTQLERQEQIAHKLEQLIESERQHHEQLEREERIMNANMRHRMITLPVGSPLATLTPVTDLVVMFSGFSNHVIIASYSSIFFIAFFAREFVHIPLQKVEEDLVPSTQCSVIRKFVRVFDISDAIEWIHMNCPIAKIYFPEESCEQVEKLFKFCLQ
uniref:aECM cysteine-cradle domain-containing protein n=2 Tax=Wuchereria bancrofti TaxID=6293 RepID=A0AAF5PM32_WUCBA